MCKEIVSLLGALAVIVAGRVTLAGSTRVPPTVPVARSAFFLDSAIINVGAIDSAALPISVKFHYNDGSTSSNYVVFRGTWVEPLSLVVTAAIVNGTSVPMGSSTVVALSSGYADVSVSNPLPGTTYVSITPH